MLKFISDSVRATDFVQIPQDGWHCLCFSLISSCTQVLLVLVNTEDGMFRIVVIWSLHSAPTSLWGETMGRIVVITNNEKPGASSKLHLKADGSDVLVSIFEYERVLGYQLMVDIYLKVAIDDSNTFLHFLSIPLSDIQRLSIRPLKWLRFVAFAICGAHGELYETTAENAVPVDYNNSDLVESSQYYYIPDPGQSCTFIDHNGLNDRTTFSAYTQRRPNFREDIKQRDGDRCVFTGMKRKCCNATHIIPKSKGNEYIQRVLQYRSHLYHPSPAPEISINDIPNGIFLNKVLHAEFAHGDIAFLKTPNFALNPDDIPRNLIQIGDPTPLNRITLQELVHDDYAEVSTDNSRDANFRGESNLQNLRPPSILLDYMYGIAAYKHWKTKDSHAMVNQYFSDNYESIPIPPPSDPSESDTSGPSSERLEKTMDETNFLMMYLNGITPQTLAAKWQAEEEKKQSMAHQESQAKVTGWLQRVPIGEQLEGEQPSSTELVVETSAVPGSSIDG